MELNKTELFHDVSQDHERSLKFSRFGYNGGTSSDLYTYICGYKLGLKAMMDYYIVLDAGDIDKLDEIAIPIAFQSRHIVELYLKYFYMKFVKNKDKYGSVKPIVTGSHVLEDLYKEIEDTLKLLCSKAQMQFCNEEVKDYIQQLDKIDLKSFAFRYPYDKEMKSNFDCSIAINVMDYYRKMVQLYAYFDSLLNRLDEHFAKETYDKRLAQHLLASIEKYWDSVEKAYNIVDTIYQEETGTRKEHTDSKQPFINLADVDLTQSESESRLFEFVYNHKHEELEIINLLLFTGQDLYHGNYMLVQNDKEERIEDLKRLLTINWSIKNIHSDKVQLQNYKLIETSPKYLLKWFGTIIGVIEELGIFASNREQVSQ